MQQILDLRNIQVPTLDLIFNDETTIHVTLPTEALISEMEVWANGGLSELAKGDRASTDMAFDLFARLLSCNKEGIILTAEDLRTKYGMNIWTLKVVASGYMEFISKINSEKN